MTKPISITVHRGIRKSEKNQPFKFSHYGLREWDMMGPILRKKQNKIVPNLLATLNSKYEELEKDARSLGIDHEKALAFHGLLIPEPSQNIGKKKKVVEQEFEQFIAALQCNKTPPQGVKFVPNRVIKSSEYGIFFIDEFGQQAF